MIEGNFIVKIAKNFSKQMKKNRMNILFRYREIEKKKKKRKYFTHL